MTCAEVRDLAPAYLLRALEADEEAAVSEHLATCPESHAEFAALGAGVAALAESVPLVEPPAGLKGRILAAAAKDLEERRLAEAAPAPVAPAVVPTRAPSPATPGVSEAPRSGGMRAFLDALVGRTPGAWAMRAVAVVAIVALAGWNLALQGELAGTKSYQQRLDEALALARQPGAQLALLAPAGGGTGPSGIAVMPPSGQGRLVMSGLAPTIGSQIYEAWAILEGQAPVPVGGFTVGKDGVGYFDAMPAAGEHSVIVAITLEPAPNPSAPSSDPISLGVAAPIVGTSEA